MRILILLLLTAQLALSQTPPGAAAQAQRAPAGARSSQTPSGHNAAETFNERVKQIAASGRVQLIGETSAARRQPSAPLAPGAPPILAFRYFDGQARHRFGDLDLVMDDAGH